MNRQLSRHSLAVLSILLACVAGACTDQARPALVASDIVIKEQLPGQHMSAAYLTLTNTSDTDIVISDVSSPNYRSVEVHESSVENGVARMRAVPELVIAANSETELRPGGLHLMLMNAKDANEVSLHFFADSTLLLTVNSKVTRGSQP